MSDKYTGPDQRAPQPMTTTAKAGVAFNAGVGLLTAHWLLKCFVTGHWVYIPPEDAVVETWLLTVIPIFDLLSKIITIRLQKLAGEQT